MEIPEMNMNILSDFEVGMKCLQNPSFISRFWKWGALIFAIYATFSSIIRRIKLIFIRFHTVKPSPHQIDEVIEFSDDDDDDDVSLASSDDEIDERRNAQTTSFSGQRRVDEDFCVKGFKSQWQNGVRQRRRRSGGGGSWSEFSYGKNVVKLWDSLGLSLDFDEDLFNYESKSVVSTWENHEKDKKSSDFFGGVWDAPPVTSATVVLTAECNGKGDGVILSGYDTRMRSRFPALYAEWDSPPAAAAAGGDASGGGVGKVYVRDDVSGVVTVGDVRNVRRPLESVRESDGETWWDADAVIVEDECNESG